MPEMSFSTSEIRGFPLTRTVSTAMLLAFSPILSKSVVAFKILITTRKSVATGCCNAIKSSAFFSILIASLATTLSSSIISCAIFLS